MADGAGSQLSGLASEDGGEPATAPCTPPRSSAPAEAGFTPISSRTRRRCRETYLDSPPSPISFFDSPDAKHNKRWTQGIYGPLL